MKANESYHKFLKDLLKDVEVYQKEKRPIEELITHMKKVMDVKY